jgi:archaellum component FlaF (FlaF/FlaG flagellin family)
MSPNITGEIDLTSYKFEDSNDCVTVTLYANGAIELKDIEVFSETDSLEVFTPGI